MTAFYEDLGRCFRDRRFFFLNYGYAPPGAGALRWVRPEDRVYKYHLALARVTLEGLDLQKKSILEIGCGRGGNCYYLARYTNTGPLFGVDLSPANIDFCRRAHRRLPVCFVRGDAQCLPFREGSFDVVINLESSHCYPRLDLFLAETRRVLKRGGIFAYSDFWRLPIFPWDWDLREQQLRESGLTLMAEKNITEGVFQALKRRDGLTSFIERFRTRRNEALLNRIVEANKAMRISLASGLCPYRVLRFQA